MILENIYAFFGKVMFFAGYVQKQTSFEKPLSEEEELACIRASKQGCKESKEKLIRHNLRLVAHIVKKYSNAGEADDLISVGSIGLIKAVNSYQEGKGSALSTYAARCIENEILMLIRVSKKHKLPLSLNEPIGQDRDGNELTINDVVEDKDEDLLEKVDKKIISQKLIAVVKKNLTKREYAIICMRYGLDNTPALTQREIATKLDISRSYISRLETKAIEIIRSKIDKDI